MRRMLMLGVMMLAVLILVAGCSRPISQPLSPEEAAAVEKFESLPKSAQTALMAKNLLDVKITSKSSDEISTEVMETLIRNGAVRSDQKVAELTVSTRPAGNWGEQDVIISDGKGNNFTQQVAGEWEARAFAQELADTLGTEIKVKALTKAGREGWNQFNETVDEAIASQKEDQEARK